MILVVLFSTAVLIAVAASVVHSRRTKSRDQRARALMGFDEQTADRIRTAAAWFEGSSRVPYETFEPWILYIIYRDVRYYRSLAEQIHQESLTQNRPEITAALERVHGELIEKNGRLKKVLVSAMLDWVNARVSGNRSNPYVGEVAFGYREQQRLVLRLTDIARGPGSLHTQERI